MNIEEMIDVLNAMKKKHGNVDVRAVAPMNSGFLKVDEVLHRSNYHDDNMFFDGEQEKGNFISIEWCADERD